MIHLQCMRKLSVHMFLAVGWLVMTPVLGWSQGDQVVTLKDGSIIKGKLLSYQNGTYTVQNSQLGQLQLKSEDVVSVGNTAVLPTLPSNNGTASSGQNPLAAAGISGASPEVTGQMVSVQSQILSNPQMMQEIGKMTEDPELLKLMTDPELMKELMAVANSHNTDTIKNDPRFQQILANPHMQTLLNTLASPASSK